MIRTGVKSSVLTFLLFALVAVMAMPAMAAEKKVKKVDNFVIFLDHSGSMAMEYAKADDMNKMEVATMIAQNMQSRIPQELDYMGAVATFAPYRIYLGPDHFDWVQTGETIGQISTDFGIYGRFTPMGAGLGNLDSILSSVSGKTAVIVISDGINNKGVDPVAQAQMLADTYPGVCFHTISVQADDEGQKVLDGVAAATGGCSVMTTSKDMMKDANVEEFVKTVFYDVVMVEEAKPEPAAKPKPVAKEDPCDQRIVFRDIQFDFDKSVIRDDMKPILNEAVDIMKDLPCDFVFEGHTCNIGPEKYNMGLGERRADAVKEYAIEMGVPASRIETESYGESSPKYDNSTREGRRLNRRVEIRMK